MLSGFLQDNLLIKTKTIWFTEKGEMLRNTRRKCCPIFWTEFLLATSSTFLREKRRRCCPFLARRFFCTISFWDSPLSKHAMLPNLHQKMFAYFIADKKTEEKCGPIFCPQESVALSCSYFALAKEEDMLPNFSQKIFLLSHCEHFFHQRRRTSWPVLPRRLFCHTF